MGKSYDRSAEDVGNIVALEHVNVRISDQRLGTIFYINGMGFTRDPYLTTGVDNMWINIGRSQVHLPIGRPDVLRGHVGIVVPDRDGLLDRLAGVKADLADTLFSFTEEKSHVDVISPWGNLLRCYSPEPRFGRIALGMPYVEFDVPVGAAASIARFYGELLGSRSTVSEDEAGSFARCPVGYLQDLIFRETDRPQRDYDGEHVQIYLADFSRPYAQLLERDLVIEESSQWQYRFKDIVDPDSNEVVFTLEHEVRSMTHPLYGRPLVNRDPNRTTRDYVSGHEDLPWLSTSGD